MESSSTPMFLSSFPAGMTLEDREKARQRYGSDSDDDSDVEKVETKEETKEESRPTTGGKSLLFDMFHHPTTSNKTTTKPKTERQIQFEQEDQLKVAEMKAEKERKRQKRLANKNKNKNNKNRPTWKVNWGQWRDQGGLVFCSWCKKDHKFNLHSTDPPLVINGIAYGICVKCKKSRTKKNPLVAKHLDERKARKHENTIPPAIIKPTVENSKKRKLPTKKEIQQQKKKRKRDSSESEEDSESSNSSSSSSEDDSESEEEEKPSPSHRVHIPFHSLKPVSSDPVFVPSSSHPSPDNMTNFIGILFQLLDPMITDRVNQVITQRLKEDKEEKERERFASLLLPEEEDDDDDDEEGEMEQL